MIEPGIEFPFDFLTSLACCILVNSYRKYTGHKSTSVGL